MRGLLGSAAPLIRARDREKLMNLDRALHHQISLAARNPILADMLTLLHERSLRFWLISFGDALQLRRVDDEHRNILEACGRSKRMSAPSPTD
jgi:DNA-binding GntR family transcriptional regulator